MIEGMGGTDHENIRKLAWSDPAFFARLMDILVEATSAYLIAQADAGAEVLQLFESWAGTVPAGLFECAVLGPTARIVKAVKAKHPAIPIIGFPRGAGAWASRYAQATGVDGIGVDQMTDMANIKTPAQIALQGNLDPILLLQGGEAMRAEARRIIAAMVGRPFIFNLGHGVMQPTPPEHVAELVKIIRS
jgi:uroporphyrinogen decarboxylase